MAATKWVERTASCPRCSRHHASTAHVCPECGLDLDTHCSQCGAELLLSQTHCGACGAERAYLPADLGVEWRQLTVLFCDLVESTVLAASLGAETLQALLREYHSACAQIIGEHGGHVAQYLGDGLLAYFGYPQAHEDDARRALRAAMALVHAIERLHSAGADRLRVRVGVHTGAVVIGEIGDPQRRERLAVGETVNVASRVHQLARPDAVVISAATAQLVERHFELRDLGAHSLRGITQPVALFEVVRERTPSQHADLALRAGLTPFQGSRGAIEQVVAAFARAQAGESALVVISGEAGVGKSRCVHEVRAALAGTPATWQQTRCSPDRQQRTLSPFVELLESMLAAEGHAGETDERKLQRLRALLPPELTAPQFDALARLLFLSASHDSTHIDVGSLRLQQLMFEGVAAWLAQLPGAAPQVLLIEDAHWADPSTLELLGMFAATPNAARLIVVTTRTELKLPQAENVLRVSLERITRDDARHIVESIAAGRTMPSELVARILDRAEDLPLFVEELTRNVLQAQGVHALVDRLEFETPAHELSVPPTLQETVAARLDRLGEHRTLAQVAAVLGRQFERGLLARVYTAIAGGMADDVGAGLRAMLAARVIDATERPDGYMFRHAMIQDVAYASLASATRQLYHRVVVQQLGAASRELLAHHCARGGLAQQALEHYSVIGQRALSNAAFREAAGAFESALERLELLPESPERDTREMELCASLGLSILATEGFSAPAVERVYRRGMDLTDRRGRGLPRLLYGMWAFHMLRGNNTETGRIVPLYQGMLAQSDNPRERLIAGASLGSYAFFRGRYEEALEALNQSIALYDQADPRAQNLQLIQNFGFESYVAAPLFRGWAQLFMGRDRESAADVEFGLRLATATGHPYVRCSALGSAAPIAHDLTDLDRAEAYADEMLATSQQYGYVYWLGSALIVKGWVLTMRSGGAQGLALLDQGLDIFNALGARLTYAYYLSYRVEALLMLGRAQEASSVAEVALRTGEDGLNAVFVPELRRLKGEALRALGDHATARRQFQLSLATTQAQGAHLLSLRAARSLAGLLVASGERVEAQKLVRDALAALDPACALAEVAAARAWVVSVAQE